VAGVGKRWLNGQMVALVVKKNIVYDAKMQGDQSLFYDN